MTSSDNQKSKEERLIEKIQELLTKTATDFENTLGDTREASSVRLAGLTQTVTIQAEDLKKVQKAFELLQVNFEELNDLLFHDDKHAEGDAGLSWQTKLRILWKKYRQAEQNRFAFTGRDWVQVVHTVLTGLLIWYITKGGSGG